MFTYNVEGYKRNKFYLAELMKNDVMFLFIQEHWLPHYNACNQMSRDFPCMTFMTTSSDMFTPPEDLILQSGATWHGTALGWPSSLDTNMTKLPNVSDRLCGVQYLDLTNNIDILSYCAYLPTAGRDDEFTEVLSILTLDILKHVKSKSAIIIGLDSNQRRTEVMVKF